MKTKGKYLGFRLDDFQYQYVSHLADVSGLSMGAVIRELITKARMSPATHSLYMESLEYLSSVGTAEFIPALDALIGEVKERLNNEVAK
ncbi:hypothetical protein [uncultured Nostoc sp.]|uniref:hypothetical protein n=1 Tax=uncultured Nostoc sp. TaxID=340711 RepID=UPI0035CB0F04